MDERKKELRVKYDTKGDILYLSFGAPRKAFSDEGPDGLVIRRAFDSNEVVGVTIIDFSKRGEEDICVPLPFATYREPDLIEA